MNIIQTKGAPAAIGPYSQGISTGKLLFTSGQLPVNPADGAMPGRHRRPGRVELQKCGRYSGGCWLRF